MSTLMSSKFVHFLYHVYVKHMESSHNYQYVLSF